MKIQDLPQPLVQSLKHLGYTEFTPIQAQAIPEVRKGRDIVAQSATGSGKTAAFGIPILEMVKPGQPVQALILTPTRELCVQVSDSIKGFAKFMSIKVASVYGGVGFEPQVDAVRHCEIVVGTPGRVLDHLERRTFSLKNIHFFVLDEADKMLEMGFIEAIEEVMRQLPPKRQTLLFSATFPPAVHTIVKKYLNTPAQIKHEVYVDKTKLRQEYYVVQPHEKFSILVHFLKKNVDGIALIFCATRREVDVVASNLKQNSIKAMAIHGGLTQNKRQFALNALKKGSITTLVATDVAARGLDISSVSHVYNYDVPKTSEEYIHRIGRTARAGMEGDAITLLSQKDFQNFDAVLRDRSLEIHKQPLPVHEKVQFSRGERREFGGREGGFSRGGRGGFSGSRSSEGGFSRGGGFGKRDDAPRSGSRSYGGSSSSFSKRDDAPSRGGRRLQSKW